MTAPSENDVAYAGRLVDALLDPDRLEGIELEHSLVVSDVESDAREFDADLRTLDQYGLPVPAVRLGDGDTIPVALDLLIAEGGRTYPGRLDRLPWPDSEYRRVEYLYYYLQSWPETAEFRESIPMESARSTFFRRATDFLSRRISTGVAPLQ